MGLTDVVVVDTPDALLVARREDLGRLREVVEEMASASYPEVGGGNRSGPFDVRQGTTITDVSERVSRLELAPGEMMHREAHGDASRHWIVLDGPVQVTVGGRAATHEADQSIRVPAGVAHTIANPGLAPVTLVEVHLITKPAR